MSDDTNEIVYEEMRSEPIYEDPKEILSQITQQSDEDLWEEALGLHWNEHKYNIGEFLSRFELPQIVKVHSGRFDDGFCNLRAGEVIVIHKLWAVKKVIASDCYGGNLFLPLMSPKKVDLRPTNYDDTYKSIEELGKVMPKFVRVVSGYHGRSHDDMVCMGDKLILKEMDHENGVLECEVYNTAQNLKLTHECQAEFRPLSGMKEYSMEEVVNLLQLPAHIQFIDREPGEDHRRLQLALTSGLGVLEVKRSFTDTSLIATLKSEGNLIATVFSKNSELEILPAKGAVNFDMSYNKLCQRFSGVINFDELEQTVLADVYNYYKQRYPLEGCILKGKFAKNIPCWDSSADFSCSETNTKSNTVQKPYTKNRRHSVPHNLPLPPTVKKKPPKVKTRRKSVPHNLPLISLHHQEQEEDPKSSNSRSIPRVTSFPQSSQEIHAHHGEFHQNQVDESMTLHPPLPGRRGRPKSASFPEYSPDSHSLHGELHQSQEDESIKMHSPLPGRRGIPKSASSPEYSPDTHSHHGDFHRNKEDESITSHPPLPSRRGIPKAATFRRSSLESHSEHEDFHQNRQDETMTKSPGSPGRRGIPKAATFPQSSLERYSHHAGNHREEQSTRKKLVSPDCRHAPKEVSSNGSSLESHPHPVVFDVKDILKQKHSLHHVSPENLLHDSPRDFSPRSPRPSKKQPPLPQPQKEDNQGKLSNTTETVHQTNNLHGRPQVYPPPLKSFQALHSECHNKNQFTKEQSTSNQNDPVIHERKTTEHESFQHTPEKPLSQRSPHLPGIPEDLSNLSVMEVGFCLDMLHMGQYVEKFEEEEVDGSLLVSLDEESLLSLGLTKFHCKKLQKLITGWRPNTENS